eukprot:GFUD01039795.1.p1 GENE.GFUD01039795.1~~GFUD01039795.1.p1  ORF type:complete len:102 (+),score=31.14 GFUD01039795.1:116-421(+)
MSSIEVNQSVEDDSSKSVIDQYEEMIKSVLHLRMKTAKMTQAAVLVYQPELELKVENLKLGGDSNDLATRMKKVDTQEILTFEEVKNKVDEFCNNPYNDCI